jgi:hypothetical protein
VQVGPLAFTGYSSYDPQPSREFRERCFRAIRSRLDVAGIDLRNVIFLSHTRAWQLKKFFPSLLLHLYGHIHRYESFERGGTRYINVSAVDGFEQLGNYAVIEIDQARKIEAECHSLSPKEAQPKTPFVRANDALAG